MAVKRQKKIGISSQLLNWEHVETVRKSLNTKLLLPFWKIDSSQWRHGIWLLPFRKIINIRFGINSHHLSLKTQDGSLLKGRLEERLRYVIVVKESQWFVNVPHPKLSADQVLLSLAKWCKLIRGMYRVDWWILSQAKIVGRILYTAIWQNNNHLDILAQTRLCGHNCCQ